MQSTGWGNSSRFLLALIFVVILTSCSSGGGGGGSADNDNNNNNGGGSIGNNPDPALVGELIADLSALYGPILYLHSSEPYFPSNIEWYLSQSQLAGSNTAKKCDAANPCNLFNIAAAMVNYR